MADNSAPTPTLEHGIAPPEELLPPTQWWIWAIIAVTVVAVLFLLFWVRRSIQAPVFDDAPPLPDYYRLAKESLNGLEAQVSKRPVSEIAAEASLAVRGFLAGALSEPALFETTEEFSERAVHLPKDAEDLLNDLNDSKYSPSHISAALSEQLVGRSLACLKTLHTANTLTQ